MPLAVVADADLRERSRCLRVLAAQTPLGALGVASWEELDQAFDTGPVGVLFYAPTLPGAPDDAVPRLVTRAVRVVVTGDGAPSGGEGTAGALRVARPVAEETLVLMARAAAGPPAEHVATFPAVDFLQMICMSEDSHVLVLSSDGVDAGVIEVRGGQVWTAFDGIGVGEDAFARLIRPEMRARVSPAAGSTKERTIFKDSRELMLESLHRVDEGSVSRPPPLSPLQLEAALASPEHLAGRIKRVNADARRLLMERDYGEAARVLVELSELDPTSKVVRANLEQLRRLGYPK
jgi:hypothetical protein